MTTGIISGTVKVATEDGAPASNSTIRVYERDTGLLVTEGITDVDGTIILQGLDSLKLYTLVAVNNLFPGYNAGIIDNIKPLEDEDILILTSGLYPIITDDAIDVFGEFISANMLKWPLEDIYLAPTFISGNLQTIVINYTYWPYEEIDLAPEFISGTLTVTIAYINYTYWPYESINLSPSLIGATLA